MSIVGTGVNLRLDRLDVKMPGKRMTTASSQNLAKSDIQQRFLADVYLKKTWADCHCSFLTLCVRSKRKYMTSRIVPEALIR